MKKIAKSLIMLLVVSLLLPLSVSGQEAATQEGSLTIYKFEQDPVDGPYDDEMPELMSASLGDPLEGVTFEITQTA